MDSVIRDVIKRLSFVLIFPSLLRLTRLRKSRLARSIHVSRCCKRSKSHGSLHSLPNMADEASQG